MAYSICLVISPGLLDQTKVTIFLPECFSENSLRICSVKYFDLGSSEFRNIIYISKIFREAMIEFCD
jgi:hypothetical protein